MRKEKKLLSLLLCIGLILSGVNLSFAASGTFTLAAAKGGQVLIEPVQIPYKAGQSIAEALAQSGYRFNGLENGYITEIEGEVGNFVRFYDNGGYNLDAAASEISALVFTESDNYSEALVSLVKNMSAYRMCTNNVQNYAPAKEAYEIAKTNFGTADEAGALQLNQALNQAMQDYEAILNGKKYSVNFSAMQDGTLLSAPEITLTDSYGNVSTAAVSQISVIAGIYQFSVSDGKNNRTEGTLSVTENTAVSVQLPCGQWFGDVQLLNAEKEPYPYTQNQTGFNASYQIPDTVGTSGLYLFAEIGDVPDPNTTRLRTIYTSVLNGVSYATANDRSWNSYNTKLSNLLQPGMEGRNFCLEAQYPAEDGTTQIQSFEIQIRRVPTLRSLTVIAEGTELPIEFSPETLSYQIPTVSDSVIVSAEAFAEDYTISGTGTISIQTNSGCTVTVTADGASRSYQLHFIKKEAVEVTLKPSSGVTASVYNEAGAQIAPVNGVYKLIPNEKYTYIAEKDGLYFTTASFTASAGLTVSAATPDATDALREAAFFSNSAATKPYSVTKNNHSLSCLVPDANSTVYAQATPISGYSVQARYTTQTINANTHGMTNKKDITRTVGASSSTVLNYCLANGGFSNTVTLYVSKNSSGVTYYQEYTVLFYRSLHLKSLQLSDSNGTLTLADNAGGSSFDRDKTAYTVSVDRGEESLQLSASFINEQNTTPVCGHYYAYINQTRYDSLENLVLPLNPEESPEELSVLVCHEDDCAIQTTYTITVEKTDPVEVRFRTNPSDASIFIVNDQNGRRVASSDGVFLLVPGASYTYTITKTGYVGQQVCGYRAPAENAEISVLLQKAEDNTALKDLDAEWPSFRADDYNNGVVDAAAPASSEDAVLSWATKLGDGYSSDACGCPIIVNGYLYTYAKNQIYKVDTVSGEILATGQMDHSSSFAINSPTYAEGMIFVGLADGTVQAFNADTLESLWIYRDALKGQPNCPIVYRNGYIYTGFWLGETTEANYVCLSVTDENPGSSCEAKLATWTYTYKGGFYWSGAYVSDNYLVLGTDDGESGYTTGHASILSLDPLSGELLDQQTLRQIGDIRCSITFVPDSKASLRGTCYFTTKGGYFYEIIINENGKFAENSLRSLPLYNYSSDASNPPMSTCTPTIYNGRAYIGVSGTAQFGAYSGHNITVIDIPSWSIAYTVRTHGYPQTSGLLTTAYEEETGYVNVYFFDNYTPGELRMLRDKPGMTKPEVTQTESYTDKGTTVTYQTAPVLFTPYGDQAQYAICSPIVDEYGTIYFKNDSAYLMALTSRITELEITKNPDKMTYVAGESFDGTGMTVIAHCSNGTQRDVSKYILWPEEALTKEDTEFPIIFPYAMYQDADGTPGTDVQQPFAVLQLTIEESAVMKGDVDGDGMITSADATLVYAIANGKLNATEQQRIAADVNCDGVIDSADATLVYAYANSKITEF